VTVVMLMRVVGLIMVIALLTMPAAIGVMYAKDLRRAMALAAVLGMVFTVVGLWLSYRFDLTSGATIILVATAAYLGSLVLQGCWRKSGWNAGRNSAMSSGT
jgi:zinc transport system permease protein